MRVHVICRDFEGDNVLARLARVLRERNGWTLSASPDPHCDLNFFQCYIEYAEKFSDWHHTPIAAYFSHYEHTQSFKTFWWSSVIDTVDLRITTARQYEQMCAPHGPTVLVPVPIDPQFTPGPRTHNDVPRVGLAGYVTSGGRKGERLVAQLAGSKLGDKIELVATGAGWPVRNIMARDWAQLPDFYRSLDVFLCTSLIEGVPMPPLEALACGTPVVVPNGVGLLSDIEGVGVYHYAAGDFTAMETMLKQAIADHATVDPATVATYTPDAWARGHDDAFRALLSKPTNGTQETDRHGQRGAYYVAFGEPARKCAQGAILSFKRHMPGIPVALVSDRPLGPEDVFIPHADEDIGGRLAKIKIYELAPKEWEYILYLDADTEIVADISYLYHCLEDGWEFVICKNPDKYHIARAMVRSDNHDECDFTFKLLGTDEVIQLNGGVFAFQRNPRVAAFFAAWLEEWHRYGKRDQGALLRALRLHPLEKWVLGNEFNHITRYEDGKEGHCVAHYPMTARRWRGVVNGRIDGAEAWAAVKAFEQGGGR